MDAHRLAMLTVARDHLAYVEQDYDREDLQTYHYGSIASYREAYDEAMKVFTLINSRDTSPEELTWALNRAADLAVGYHGR